MVESSRGKFEGVEQLRGIPAMVAGRYLKTFHAVLNQLLNPVEGGAEGETTASRGTISAIRPAAIFATK